MRRYFYSIFLLAFLGVLIYSLSEANAKKRQRSLNPMHSFYDLQIKSLDGKNTYQMKDFKGKYILCVNVASECGYTPQYADLQKLYDTYADKLVVIGFPCNQFSAQEPGNAEEIQNFCKKNYGVTFLLTEKIEVKGSDQHAVYQWLTQKSLNGKADVEIKWNFNKILVDPTGNWLHYFPSSVKPLSAEITGLIK